MCVCVCVCDSSIAVTVQQHNNSTTAQQQYSSSCSSRPLYIHTKYDRCGVEPASMVELNLMYLCRKV